ncbi:MAG TPA: hypothetical protein VGH51_13415 [Candidatus Angelobacter sp.]
MAVPLAAQSATEDPPPAIVEGSVINIQNSRTVPRASVTLLRVKGTSSGKYTVSLKLESGETRN